MTDRVSKGLYTLWLPFVDHFFDISDSVLVFPPFCSRYRYLLHEITQKFFGQTLATISIGREGSRRPLLYFKSLTDSPEMLQNIGTEAKQKSGDESSAKPTAKSKKCSKNGKTKAIDKRHRRPDMKLYVPPKAKNSSADEMDSPEDQTIAQTAHPKTGHMLDSLSELHITESSSHSKDKCSQSLCSEDNCSQSDRQEMSSSASNHLNESTADTTAEDNPEDGSWDSIFDESGECVRPEMVDKVNDLIGHKNSDLSLEKSRIDYYNFQYNEPEIDNSEFGHILEVYDFATELKTQDLVTAISVFNCRDFDIKWVDDTHALIVFSKASAATEALKYNYPNVKLRPLSQAIRESKAKARKCAEFLQPYKQRPETSASLARRLVTQSLGLRDRITPEQRAAERKKLAEAKERKRMAIKQGIDVWEGNI